MADNMIPGPESEEDRRLRELAELSARIEHDVLEGMVRAWLERTKSVFEHAFPHLGRLDGQFGHMLPFTVETLTLGAALVKLPRDATVLPEALARRFAMLAKAVPPLPVFVAAVLKRHSPRPMVLLVRDPPEIGTNKMWRLPSTVALQTDCGSDAQLRLNEQLRKLGVECNTAGGCTYTATYPIGSEGDKINGPSLNIAIIVRADEVVEESENLRFVNIGPSGLAALETLSLSPNDRFILGRLHSQVDGFECRELGYQIRLENTRQYHATMAERGAEPKTGPEDR